MFLSDEMRTHIRSTHQLLIFRFVFEMAMVYSESQYCDVVKLYIYIYIVMIKF